MKSIEELNKYVDFVMDNRMPETVSLFLDKKDFFETKKFLKVDRATDLPVTGIPMDNREDVLVISYRGIKIVIAEKTAIE